jgi:very-short-patch-repair endonuclease
MSRARYLRKNPTPAEKKLWRYLRNREFAGYKFRRQHPIGPYVLDFYWPAARLALELDGSGHCFSTGQEHDSARQAFLAESGIRVLRFYNQQVYREFDGVLQAIWFALDGVESKPRTSEVKT